MLLPRVQELTSSEEEGGARITETMSKIENGEGILVELKTVIMVYQGLRAEATQAPSRAGAASAFDGESADLAANTDFLTRATAALEKCVVRSSFLQSLVGSSIRIVPCCCLSCRTKIASNTRHKAVKSMAI